MTGNTQTFLIDAPVNSLALNKDATQVAVAGRNVFKIISISDVLFEKMNLRVGKHNLNFSTADVAWSHHSDNILASGATNGSVIIWDLNKKAKSKQQQVFSEHKRSVNRVCFHRNEPYYLLTADQNGLMKLFDLREQSSCLTFAEPSQCNVRDIKFSPFDGSYNFCGATENGCLQMWDSRRSDQFIWELPAQAGPIYTIDWHPEERSWIATAGRDQIIKVWDINDMNLRYSIQTITDVARIRWRPKKRFHIASCALQLDCNVNVWDLRRPFIPFASFNKHTDVAKDIVWKQQDPRVFLSSGRDQMLIQHVFIDAQRPADHAVPAALNLSTLGQVTFALGEKILQNTERSSRGTGLFKKPVDLATQFLDHVTSTIFTTHGTNMTIDELNMDWFVETAKQYILSGHSLHHLCDHNATVAMNLGRRMVGQTWQTFKLLYPGSTKSKSGKTFHLNVSSGDKVDGEKGRTSVHQYSSALDDTSTSGSSDEEFDSDTKLTTIASGISAVDGQLFFGNDDTDFLFDAHVSNFDPSKTDLTLPVEAFHHRHEIVYRSAPPEDLQNGTDSPASPIESDLSSHQPQNLPTAGYLLDMKMGLDEFPRFSFTDLVVDALMKFSEEGDVQSSVCMLLVLGDRIQSHIPHQIQELWFTSYIDLLGRYELWNRVNEVIKLSNIEEVVSLNQQSTLVSAKCASCHKVLNNVGWLCARCKLIPSTCSVCNLPVKGVYTWCQGCSHGGHIDHMRSWYERNKLCPTGCGHLCEFA